MTGIDYDCEGCGRRHEGADGTEANPWPLLEFDGPEAYLRMNPWERVFRARATEEMCLIDNGDTVDCYVTGVLSLPVRDEEARLLYVPWVKLREADYVDLLENWGNLRFRGSYRGTLASVLPGCEHPQAVPVLVTAPGQLPPLIEPDPASGHALVREQREGISRQEAELRIRSMLLEDTEV
ncbi:DUF2199 domain-containing protein [Brachybacterium sp. AOP43-C2-M15]|uniref:DUF2199 domain-containing protein n=1 Tax=Brachybacterium sp. AOP43-C2-M15 TaxID=3457661 RepID=UPI00403418DA